MAMRMFSAALRTMLRRNNTTAVAVCNKLSTDAKSAPSPIYELRVYRTHPADFQKASRLFQEYVHLRLNHSKLFGFWTAEIGDSIFQMVHLWEYENLSHRRKVRTSMLNDKAWQTEFLPQVMPCMQSMTNALIAPVPGTKLNVDFINDPSAVYKLQTAERETEEVSPEIIDSEEEILVGRFYGILGPTEVEYRLWRFTNIDTLVASSWNNTVLELPEDSVDLLLYPTSFSPIQ